MESFTCFVFARECQPREYSFYTEYTETLGVCFELLEWQFYWMQASIFFLPAQSP